MSDAIFDKIFILPGIIIAMAFHEFAHALAAHWMGDDTAERMGRLTLNPISHIDPVGLACLLFGRFGWARPVPFNENNFENRNLGVFVVSIAGVTMNILIAIVSFLLLKWTAGLLNNDVYNEVIFNIAWINIAFAAFNLLPIPPLDGSKILASFLPTRQRQVFYHYERYGMILMIVLIATGATQFLLEPLVTGIFEFISFVVGI